MGKQGGRDLVKHKLTVSSTRPCAPRRGLFCAGATRYTTRKRLRLGRRGRIGGVAGQVARRPLWGGDGEKGELKDE